jgi:hypothetical protein
VLISKWPCSPELCALWSPRNQAYHWQLSDKASEQYQGAATVGAEWVLSKAEKLSDQRREGLWAAKGKEIFG